MDTPQITNITVIPTGAALGADVVGVDLSKPIAAKTFRQIEDAWHTRLVLRFRDQHLDDPALLAFGRMFGELDQAPVHAYVIGLPLAESEDLLNRLWAHAAQPRFEWYQKWKVGDLVMWDNRCAMHRRDAFDPESRRLMHRTQVRGDKPFFDPKTLDPRA